MALPDVFVVDGAGNILYRAGRIGQPGQFAPPVIVNPGDPSRDIAFIVTSQGPLLASADANDNQISFFALRSGAFVLVGNLAAGDEPAQILAADLDGNGNNDLIVRNAGDGTISIFLSDGHGWFLPPIDLESGLVTSDIEVADLHHDGRLDLIYSNAFSGQVGVFENLGGGAFAPPVVYAAGAGPYGVTASGLPSPVSSREGTTTIATGSFLPSPFPAVVALNAGANTFGLLAGLADGGLSNPTIFPVPGNPLVIRAVSFANERPGLAILTTAGLFIEHNNGHGGFDPPTEINVGFQPNGLTVADLNGDGTLDLLVGNPSGDVEVLLGNASGTFQPVQNLDQQVSLALYAPGGNTPAAFIFANQLTNQLVVTTPGGATTVLGSASTGLISPARSSWPTSTTTGFST